MKKTYITPALVAVQLGSRDALLQSVSAESTLGGTSYRGTTTDNSVTDADVKSSKNVWDEEW